MPKIIFSLPFRLQAATGGPREIRHQRPGSCGHQRGEWSGGGEGLAKIKYRSLNFYKYVTYINVLGHIWLGGQEV